MVQILTTFFIAGSILTPSVFLSLFIRQRWQQKLKRTQNIIKYLNHNESVTNLNNNHALETNSKPIIGNSNCFYNAQSPYLRCAVNPNGSCDRCSHFQEL